MHTLDDAQLSNSTQHDDNHSTQPKHPKQKEVTNPPRRLSISDSRNILRLKLTSSPLPTPDIGFVSKVISREEETNLVKHTAYNMPPQTTIVDPVCEKKSARLRRSCVMADRVKFSGSLSRREIEHDFIVITGKKPPGKPKKRPRVVQDRINAVFPGNCLTEIHADKYQVKENGKR